MLNSSLPRVQLKPQRALPFHHRHPWVFEGAIARVDPDLSLGQEVLLVSDRGEPIARGLYNANSKIKVRLYEWDVSQPLDNEWFAARIDSALALRHYLSPGQSDGTSGRMIASEGDRLSGLTVDLYENWLSVQFTSAALATRRDVLIAHLVKALNAQGIVLRSEKKIKIDEGLDIPEGLVWGEPPPRPQFLTEHGVTYGVDLLEGQKTGFYLDQRENRLAAARYARGRLLDLFCYSGGFGLTALKHGHVSEVVGVDVSEAAIRLAQENARLNGLKGQTHYHVQKVFEFLETAGREGERFETIVLDPPKMTRSRQSVKNALKGYYSLNRLAVDLLPPGGILVTCSCSGLISREDFQAVLATVAMRAGRAIQMLESRGAAADHPVSVSCPESAYLKCLICRVI